MISVRFKPFKAVHVALVLGRTKPRLMTRTSAATLAVSVQLLPMDSPFIPTVYEILPDLFK